MLKGHTNKGETNEQVSHRAGKPHFVLAITESRL